VLENLPIPLDILAGQDLTEFEAKAVEAEKKLKAAEAALKKGDSGADVDSETAPKDKVPAKEEEEEEEITIEVVSAAKMVKKNGRSKAPVAGSSDGVVGDDDDDDEDDNWEEEEGGGDDEVDLDNIPASLADEDLGLRSGAGSPPPIVMGAMDRRSESSYDSDYRPASAMGLGSDYTNDTVVLGLRVYTSRDAPAVVGGQLRHEMKTSLEALANSAL
jgi:hypothetical protein